MKLTNALILVGHSYRGRFALYDDTGVILSVRSFGRENYDVGAGFARAELQRKLNCNLIFRVSVLADKGFCHFLANVLLARVNALRQPINVI